MKKILLVSRREYLATVRRKGFIIATLGMPVFFLLIMGIGAGVGFLAIRSRTTETNVVGIVDESGTLKRHLLERVQESMRPQAHQSSGDLSESLQYQTRNEIARSNAATEFRILASREEAKSAYYKKEIRGYYAIPPGYLETGVVELEIQKGSFLGNDRPGWTVLQRWLQASLVDGRVEETLATRLWTPSRLRRTLVDESGKEEPGGDLAMLTSFIVPYAFSILFLISIMGSAGYLLRGIAEEKENRVIEILISSLTPDELLAGKVLGLCAAGLTQIAAWSVMGIIPAMQFLPFLELRWSQLFVALLFFLLGFLLFGALMGGTGSLGNNVKESEQMSIAWTLTAVSPVFFIVPILAQPNGVWARALSYFPLTAPITVVLRVSAAPVPWWDIALSAVILVAALFLFLRLAARLFRVGVLMYGKRPSLVELVRWMRAA